MNEDVKTICKPTVHYDINKHHHIMVGMGALIHPIDHPSASVSNEEATYTSRVLNLDGDTFETNNTIYVGITT